MAVAGPSKSMDLSVTLSDVDIMLHPSNTLTDNEDLSLNETHKTIIAHIKLSIPTNVDPPDQIDQMTIEIRSDEVLAFSNGAYEKNNPDQLLINVDSAKNMQVFKGNLYQWDVPIHISHNVAPYDRGIYGKLFHKLLVTLTWSGWSAIWKGGRNLTASQMIFIATAPRNHHDLNFAKTLSGNAKGLGPVIFHIRTRHLSVGGYLRIALSIPNSSPLVTLRSLHATMIQHTTLTSRKDQNLSQNCEPERFAFWECSSSELSFNQSWITRLPHDSQIRPSSVSGSKAAIRHRHTIELKLIFLFQGELMAYTTRLPITILGCCVLWKSVKLPSYSENDPSPVPEWNRDAWESDKYPNIHTSQTVCACGQKLEKLLAWEHEGDLEQNSVSIDMLREAIKNASFDAANNNNNNDGERSSRSRSRTRNINSANTSRSASRRPSFELTHIEENDLLIMEEDQIERTSSELEWDEVEEVVRRAEEEEQLRFEQKSAQLYTPMDDKKSSLN